jgi:predicted acetyltransferase
MDDTVRYMRDHAYHVSMLFGIPNFYHRFGYVTTLAEYAITIDALEFASVKGGGLRVREAKPGDIPAIQKLHGADDGDVACSLLRSAAHVTNRWDAFRRAHVFTTAHGKVVAYLRSRDEKTHVVVQEVGAAQPAHYNDILEWVSTLAHEACVGQLRFLVPPDHPFARHLMQFNSTHETRVVREEGGMMTFIHLGETLESLLPEWEQRLAHSALRDQHCEVTLLVDNAPYRIRAHRGAIDIAEQSGQNKCSITAPQLMQMITGYRHADDVLNAERRLMTAESRKLVRTLMPKRNPYVWTFDRF